MIYFTSDLHFGDEFILPIRPEFQTIREMEDYIVHRWNVLTGITDEDIVYVLGDFSGDLFPWREVDDRDMPKELKGNIIVLPGNHDDYHNYASWGKIEFHDPYKEIEEMSRLWVLCHYPITYWKNMDKKSIHLHGHMHHNKIYNIHNKLANRLCYDVGLEANDYKPVSMDQILEFFNLKRS